MKSIGKLLGILAIVLVIGLGAMSCADGSSRNLICVWELVGWELVDFGFDNNTITPRGLNEIQQSLFQRIEFSRDGTGIIRNSSMTWRQIDDRRLEMGGRVYDFILTENNTSLRLNYGTRTFAIVVGNMMYRVSRDLVGIYRKVR